MDRLLKISSKVLTVLFTISVFIITGFIAIMIPANSRAFYNWQFQKKDYYGYTAYEYVKLERVNLTDESAIKYLSEMELEDLVDLMLRTMRYCIFLEDELNPEIDGETVRIFRQDEIDHMKDVKGVFGGGMILVLISILVVGVCLPLGLIKKKSYYENCRKVPIYTIIGIGCFLVIIALFAVFAFDFAFEVFHRIFFSGNYAFENGVMIGMIGGIFYDLAPIIILLWVILFGGFSVGLYFYHKWLKKKFK
ncbi:MAG: DUF1461 domain-containing protein [Clostridia bacterium]|nr:DUF1461 domain-containing protein [Clostridia bacterium]